MFAILARIQPLDKTTGNRVDIFVSSSPSAIYNGLGGFEWEPAIVGRPVASIELMSLDLSAGTETSTCSLTLSLPAIKNVDTSNLYWVDAPITVYRGDELAWPAPIEFKGNVSNPLPDLDTDRLALNCSTSVRVLEVDLLTATFTGDGFSGGDADKFGTLKPAGFGQCMNVEPVWFDTLRNIGMFDGYGNLLAVDWLGEGLSSLGPSIGDYANYNALAGAIDAGLVPPGRWATSIADGVVGLGAPPAGVITGHIRCGFTRSGGIMQRVIEHHAGVDPSLVDEQSFAALDVAVPYDAHYWTSEQRQVKDLVEAMAAACNATPIVTMQGMFSVTRALGASIQGTFTRNGFNEPAVTDWKTNDSIMPYWQIKGRTARPGRVFSFDEVNYTDELVDRGLYNPLTVYRRGNIVWLANKSQWLYINDVADKNHLPPDETPGDDWWQNLAPAPDATDLKYLDGTPIQNWQPAEPAATISRSISLSESTLAFSFDSSGNLITGQMPHYIQANMVAANVDVTLLTNWAIATTAGIFASIDNDPTSPTRGKITITNVTQAGTISVVGTNGGVSDKEVISITSKGTLADKSTIGTVDINGGSVTGISSFTAPDIQTTTSEATLIETPSFAIGDSTYGLAIALISFLHDATGIKDAAAEIRVYLDLGDGNGYQKIREQAQGITTTSGDTYYTFPCAFPIVISSTHAVKLKITSQSTAIHGNNVAGIWLRNIRIDLFKGAR